MKNNKQVRALIFTTKGLWLLTLIIFTLFIMYRFKSLNNNILIENNEEWISVSEIDISDAPKEIIGYLSFPSLSNEFYLNMPIKEGTNLSTIATAIGHFTGTHTNICLVAHNSGINANGNYVGYFDLIKNFKEGDLIKYNNLIETYTYKIISNIIISEKDLSVLNETEENLLTLITCVKGYSNRSYRQCVVAIKI